MQDAQQCTAIKRRFLSLNQDRLARVRESFSAEQRQFLDALPLLFHIHHEHLPGGNHTKAPCGIADFSASKRTVEAAARLHRNFNYRRRALRSYDIQAIYTMGSIGTVAYTAKSDLDVWICHDPALEGDALTHLAAKCDDIAQWARSLDLDTNFFLMDGDRLRGGQLDALSNESSGSTQRLLLLEEFYRTGLLVAGRYPAWWLVPPEHENEYGDYLQRLQASGSVRAQEFIDFGGIATIPEGEFFSAALWQLHKALGSPYKSVLKLMLIEAYAREYPHVDLLCKRFKQALYAGDVSADRLDPYILMTAKVEEHLREQGSHDRLELARRCLYFKVGERLSVRSRHTEHRRELMQQLAEQWGWNQKQLLLLDSRPSWKIHRVMEERNLLVQELNRSYQTISDFAGRALTADASNTGDLKLLGRRLYAAFERKAGKVEIINPGISENLTEERLSFVYRREADARGWQLYRSDYRDALQRRETPLKRAGDLLELVTWCHFNQLLGRQTLVTLHAEYDGLNPKELLNIIDSVQQAFPEGRLPEVDVARLRRTVRIEGCTLFVNIGIDPLSTHTRRGVCLTSNRSDALSYGGFWKNLALTFDSLVVTTWGEVITQHYHGEAALLHCVCDYLAWTPLNDLHPPPAPSVFSFSSVRGNSIAQRVEQFFNDCVDYFYRSTGGANARYVIRIEQLYYVLQPENGVLQFQKAGDYGDLLKHLSRPQDEFSAVRFDRYSGEKLVVDAIFKVNRAGRIQVFFEVHGGHADVYVVDELGSLSVQRTVFAGVGPLTHQYRRFFRSIVRRLNALEGSPDSPYVADTVEFFRIHRRGGHYVLETVDRRDEATNDYLSVEVIAARDGDREPILTLFCGDREFSTLEHGEQIFSVLARHIRSLRRDTRPYPFYLTNVDVERSLLNAKGALRLQSSHYLEYKRMIEQRLNAAAAIESEGYSA